MIFTDENINLISSSVNIILYIIIIRICEEILTNINKPLIEVARGYLFIFLFLSPILQYHVVFSDREFYSIFFMLFSLLNYSLYEKNLNKSYLILSMLGVILSIYFYSYIIFAVLPFLLIFIIKAGLKGIIYSVGTIIILMMLFICEIVSLQLIIQWNPNHFFLSSFGFVSYNIINILFSIFPLMHPLFFMAGLIVLPFIRYEDFEENIPKIAVVSFLLNAFFVAGLPFQHFNLLIITFPLLIVFLFPATMRVNNLTEYFRPVFFRILPFIIISLQLLFIGLLLSDGTQIFFNN